MLNFIYFGIIFIVIPAIIMCFFIAAAVLPGKTADRDARLSGKAGFGAGLVIFAAYAVSAIGGITSPDFSASRLPSFSWLGFAGGAVLGFAFLYIVKFALPTRGVGVLTLILSAASAVGLFSYLFTSSIRDFTMYFTLGALLGVLINVIVSPSVARGILPGSAED